MGQVPIRATSRLSPSGGGTVTVGSTVTTVNPTTVNPPGEKDEDDHTSTISPPRKDRQDIWKEEGGEHAGPDHSSGNEISTPTPTLSPIIPLTTYIESTMHRFIRIRAAQLILLRSSHPLHVVLSLSVESRFPLPLVLDALTVVIGLTREEIGTSKKSRKDASSSSSSSHSIKTRKQVSSVVVAAPPAPPPPALTMAQQVAASQNPNPIIESASASAGEPTASPKPSATATVPQSETHPQASPESSPPLPKHPSSEWTCVFRSVAVKPGHTNIVLHIFHSVPIPKEGTKETAAESQSDQEANHYSTVLYHSYRDLETLHAHFEPKHVSMRSGDLVVVVDSTTTMTTTTTTRRSPDPVQSSPVPSSTSSMPKLRVKDILFSLPDTEQVWHVDLTGFNTKVLKTSIITPKERRAQLQTRQKAKIPVHSTAVVNPFDLIGKSKDVDIGPDPFDLPFPAPATPAFRPFADKPRVTLDVLPIAPPHLLIGQSTPFNVVIQVIVGGGCNGSGSDSSSPGVERCRLRLSTNSMLRLFGSASDKETTSASASNVHGLLQRKGDSSSERRIFHVDMLRGEIDLGNLPSSSRLLLLLPLHAPGHLGHLLRTKQITLPTVSASVAGTPRTSRPSSPTRSTVAPTTTTTSASTSQSPLAAPVKDDPTNDLHSVTHPFQMDLTCAPEPSTTIPPADTDDILPPTPSFLFSSSTSLTFMEPLQLSASIERLGRRWFLQFFLWNRCTFPLTIKEYQLDLPAGFDLKRDPNTDVKNYIFPPLSGSIPNTTTDVDTSNAPGMNAAVLAASVPISSASPNVYSLVFELGTKEEDASASGASSRNTSRRQSLASEDVEDEARLAATYASAAIGRFSLRVSSSALTSPLSLSWPIDVAIMSGAQDLHLFLSFPSAGQIGRTFPFTLTVLHLRGHQKRGSSKGKLVSDSSTTVPPLDLLYHIVDPSNVWMVSGSASQSFTLAGGEQKSFTIHLLPIASGYLPIPIIELQERQTMTTNVTGCGVLAEAAQKLAKFEQQASSRTSAASLRVDIGVRSDNPTATNNAPSAPRGTYASIVPGRIQRHFTQAHPIHVQPARSLEAQMQPVVADVSRG